jgi:hypothetical protein
VPVGNGEKVTMIAAAVALGQWDRAAASLFFTGASSAQ